MGAISVFPLTKINYMYKIIVAKHTIITEGDKSMADEIFETEIYTLTDDEGVENDFELIGTVELEGVTYYALVPYTEDENAEIDEYIVLRGEKDENGEDVLVSIEDDEEFDRVADIFDDEFADVDFEEAADEE